LRGAIHDQSVERSHNQKDVTYMSTQVGTKSSGFARPVSRLAQRSCIGFAIVVAAVGFSAGAANATPSTTSGGSTQANAQVESGITLTALTSSFTLTGTPGATVSTTTPVSYNVETNDPGGYSVTVQSASSTLFPAVANGDTIPISDLTVRESGSGSYTPLSDSTFVIVHSQTVRSANLGDDLATDFQMRIPTVEAGTYSATLNYLATSAL
jgi:hypothetical protein